VCACAVVSGARSIDELAEWGRRAPDALLALIGIRRHLLGWRRTPAPATIGRVLGAVDGDALDRAVGAYLADRHRTATEAIDDHRYRSLRAVRLGDPRAGPARPFDVVPAVSGHGRAGML
jgi:hypothetical protein